MLIDVFTVTVTTAGTRVQVSTAAAYGGKVKAIAFQARPQNTGTYCYVGVSDVAAAVGWTLTKGTTVAAMVELDFGEGSLAITDFWVDADTNGDKVEVRAIFR